MKKYGLIGFPLAHSFSKKYFENKFLEENLTDRSFELFPIENIAEFNLLVQSGKINAGLAVTIPYKQTVIPFLDHLDATAAATGAVNCIKIKDNKTIGYNTDQFGFEQSLLPLLKPHHKKALILGTGGSSLAVQYILDKQQIDYLPVSRKASGGNKNITYEQVDEQIMNEYNLIINCTPVGMHPQESAKPNLPYQFLSPFHLLYDLVYNPENTAFLQQGKIMGCVTKNGMEMLALQAEENWKIWEED